MEDWQECEYLRHLGRGACVVRLCSTGAVIKAILREPMTDLSRACLISPIKPVSSRIRLLQGQGEQDAFLCDLEVEWPPPVKLPPPARFLRSKKRPRTDE